MILWKMLHLTSKLLLSEKANSRLGTLMSMSYKSASLKKKMSAKTFFKPVSAQKGASVVSSHNSCMLSLTFVALSLCTHPNLIGYFLASLP